MGRRGGRQGAKGAAEDDVEAVLDELYALPPSGFVPRREQRAAEARSAGRADDARRIRAARRPTLAAWAANLLRRSRPEEAEQFLELGRALREAFSTLDPAGLRELSAQRRRIVAELSRQAAGLARDAGHPLSDSVQRDLEETLRAVLADPQAADRWAQGRLETALTPPAEFAVTGGGTGRAATSKRSERRPSGPSQSPSESTASPAAKRDELAERRRRRQEQARAAAETAEAAEERARERRDEHAAAETAAEQARERCGEAERRVADLEEHLGAARAELERAEHERREAERQARAAADALDRAVREAKEAAREAKRLAARAR
ncbi:hypothetical protein HCJ93_17890 [Streptomyces sp. SBST2-5]|uniref:Transposase n=1 Tax=Streptomyces composti TaxID=2720025 RepID=A0ABX1A9K6_9ACTN|nr:hypothetical protein [Streptomyces composti]NJP51885.1 hypothetical protein [Streptomyces composti]